MRIVLILLALFPVNAFSQKYLSVELTDPVYTLMEITEIKGTGTRLSSAKPYSRNVISDYLRSLDFETLTSTESTIIERILQRLDNPQVFFKPAITENGFLGNIEAGIDYRSQVKVDFLDFDALHMFNALNFYLRGDIGAFLSFSGGFAGTFDKVGPDSFAPYTFTKQWDGFHIGFTEPRYSLDGIEKTPYFSFALDDEITSHFFDDNLALSLSRFRRDWGTGEGNLFLSENARPYQGFDVHARFADWCGLSWSTGSLNNWMEENKLADGTGTISYQKMMTIQMIEFFPTDWLYFSTVATAIWGKRFEPVYLSPLLYPVIAQNIIGNFDNVSQAVNLSITIPGYAKLYFSFFADEMEFSSLDAFFKRPRNMVAYQAGAKIPIPWLPLALFTFQYTKIEPFVYTHYPETNIEPMGHPVDMSYTNDGENIGFHLPPNSDEFLFKAESMIIPDLMLTLSYALIHHGTNTGDPAIDKKIFGDVNKPFNYDFEDSYPDKSFLNDGLYDWNNIVSIGIFFSLPRYNLSFSSGYTFAHTFWMPNNSGESAPDGKYRHIFSVGMTFNGI